jgi:hypothetical protein
MKTIANFDCLKILPITIKAMIKLKKYATVVAIWCLGAIESEAQSKSIGIRADYLQNSGPRIALGVTKMGERLEHTGIIGVDKPARFDGRPSLGLGYSVKYNLTEHYGVELNEYARFGDFLVSSVIDGMTADFCRGPVILEHSILFTRKLLSSKSIELESKLGSSFQHGFRRKYIHELLGDHKCIKPISNWNFIVLQLNLEFVFRE